MKTVTILISVAVAVFTLLSFLPEHMFEDNATMCHRRFPADGRMEFACEQVYGEHR